MGSIKTFSFVFLFFMYLLIMLLQLAHLSPLYSPLPCSPPHTIIPPPQFMSMGHTYKFFGVTISYTILNFPLTIFYLPLMLLIPCTFSPILPLSPSLLTTIHVISISGILFLFQLVAQFVFVFVVQVQLLIVVSLLSFYCSQF